MSDVRLRLATEADLDFIVETEGSPENSRWVTVEPRAAHAAYLRSDDVALFVVEAEAATPVGYVLMAGLQSPHGTLELRRIAIRVKGRGYGRAAFRAAKAFAFEAAGAHRLWLDVSEHNHRARSLYTSEGFQEEGWLRDAYRGPDGYESMIIMAMLEDEYRASRRA